MGIHDFDLGRMFLGEVASVHAVGGALAYPEMKSVGDIDNALSTWCSKAAPWARCS